MPKPESSIDSIDESICLDLSQDQKYWLWEREEILPRDGEYPGDTAVG